MIGLPRLLHLVPNDAAVAPAEALLAAAAQLAALLEQENAALAGLDVTRATSLVGEKARALAGFEMACLAMRGHRITEEAHCGGVQAISARLQALAEDNRRLLERAMFVQRRVLALFARAVSRTAPAQYGTPASALRRINALAFSARA